MLEKRGRKEKGEGERERGRERERERERGRGRKRGREDVRGVVVFPQAALFQRGQGCGGGK